MASTGDQQNSALYMSLDEIIEAQRESMNSLDDARNRRPRIMTNSNMDQISPRSSNNSSRFQNVFDSGIQDEEMALSHDDDDDDGDLEPCNSNSRMLRGDRDSHFHNPRTSMSQRLQNHPQNNFFPRRGGIGKRNWKRRNPAHGKNYHSSGQFCRKDCCLNKCMAQRRMLCLQSVLSETRQRCSSCCSDDSYGAPTAGGGQLRRSSSLTNLAVLPFARNRPRQSSCSCDSHVGPFIHDGQPQPHFSRSRSQDRFSGFRRSRSRSRSRSGTRSRSRSRIEGRDIVNRKDQILNAYLQTRLRELQEKFERTQQIRFLHRKEFIKPVVHTTSMSLNDRFDSLYEG